MGHAKLGELELLVLTAALRLGEDQAYAVSIVDEIREHSGREVQRATVYVVLQRLETKALVSTRMSDPVPERGGRAKRLVRLEPAGLEAIRDVRAALLSMWGGFETVLEDA